MNLEDKVKEYFQGHWPGTETPEQCNTTLSFTPLAIMRMVKHFYELGKYDTKNLTWEDIDRIGDLFNECQDELEKDHPEYSDWGIPGDVLAKKVLEKFNKEKQDGNIC